MGFGEHQEAIQNELEQLQGVGKSHAERYQDEGVTTMVDLAWYDPIDLTIRTNFELSFVIDCASQALLRLYFKDDVIKIYRFSLRGAQEVSTFIDDLSKSSKSRTGKEARRALEAAAAALQMDRDALKHTLRVVSEDPYTSFLCNIWC